MFRLHRGKLGKMSNLPHAICVFKDKPHGGAVDNPKHIMFSAATKKPMIWALWSPASNKHDELDKVALQKRCHRNCLLMESPVMLPR